ncbi:MAG: CDP-glucose 4,6-dehydratase [Solirubrobacteraceae bacterium]
MKIPASVAIDPDFWLRRRVLVTGHTGFKGAWLSLWLQALGAEVTGVAPGAPTSPSLYEQASVGKAMTQRAADVRDLDGLHGALGESAAEIVIHLAGQPMVRRSLRDPVLTYAVNLMGTVNLLEAVRRSGSQVRAVVVVTSDKCYENAGLPGSSFVEDDRLGGADPYSSSKACAELAVASYRDALLSGPAAPRLASARAGNVIGGGDWGEDRLLPDALRAVEAGTPLRVRNPDAVRPWQHVLNPLAGYLLLAQRLWEAPDAGRAWNFGPPAADSRPVGWIVRRLGQLWGGELRWVPDEGRNPPEAARLALDSSAAHQQLGWRFVWGLEDALALVVDWHRRQRRGEDMRRVSIDQITRFMQEESTS